MRCIAAACLLLSHPAVWALPEVDAKREALERAAALAERFGQFEDKRQAVNSLCNLGRVVCKYDVPLARVILRQAATAVRDSGAGTGDYRGIVLAYAARCDPELVKPLSEITEPDESDPVRSAGAVLEAARALLKSDPERAAAFAQPAIAAGPAMSREQSWELADFLFQLGEQDSSLSDRLFAEALAGFRKSLGGNWEALQTLGIYVFGPPGEKRASSSVELDGVEVYDWRARRPQASDQVVRQYVQTVAEALSKQADSGEKDQQMQAVMARQIEPFARTVAPQLLPILKETRLIARVDRDLSELFPERTFDEYLADAARSADRHERIQAQAYRFRFLWERNEFDEAAAAAAETEDPVLRSHLRQLINCGRATHALGDGELDLAHTLAGKLSDRNYQALLYLGLATAHLRNKHLDATRRSVALALHAALQAHPIVRAQLLLSVASLQAAVEPQSALATLAEAVRELDQQARANPSSRRRRGWTLRAIPGGFIVPLRDGNGRFYAAAFLRVKGVTGFDVYSAISHFEGFDLDRIDAMTEGLRDENQFADASTSTCGLRLKSTFGKDEEQ